ncbi:STAS domain-containing protein [Cerasicoccus maritimus]|uniref:STAS domain-containing protein n=1 Tax=Cerasicoccus maritimus TaxID=490089 RepID=UPI0028524CFB|nr:STAS domain-containing protein [Cerasicoccus maritimus]
MQIETIKDGSVTQLKLNGRLDASWCDHLGSVFDETIRRGEHHVQLDLADVHYLSSAGIRLLLKTFKQLKGIDGSFIITNPSENTTNVLRLAGLQTLMAEPAAKPAEQASVVTRHDSKVAEFEIHGPAQPPAVKVTAIGDERAVATGAGELHNFDSPAVLLGVGAIGRSSTDNHDRMGELLAVAGNVTYQPTDGAKQPDFMVTHGDLKADGQVISAISADALPSGLTRFEAKGEHGVIGLSELAEQILCIAKSDAAVIVAMTETAGLIGTALQRSPVAAGEEERFKFPAVRDWLSFSADRIHRDSTTLLVGIAARPGSPIEAQLRPLDAEGKLLGHFHAAAFPYHPLKKGQVELTEIVGEAFENRSIQAVLHLLADTRPVLGAGESQFYRGACWFAPAQF